MSERVRIGFGLGTAGTTGAVALRSIAAALEDRGFDSLWLSERVSTDTLDPLVALATVAGCTRRLKIGTSVLVLPGRNPFLLAAAMASLDVVSEGRFLPAVGLGVADAGEQQAFAVDRSERAGWFDEALPLIRRLWTEDEVDHAGPHFSARGVTVRPKPVQSPLEVWLGGRAPAELRRVGRLGDGWLPSFCPPAEAAEGRRVIEATAAAEGRAIDPGHFGALVIYRRGPLPPRLAAVAEARMPGVDPERVFPGTHAGLRSLLEEYIAVGVSKFVLVPAFEAEDWPDELSALAEHVLPLQA